MRSEQDTTPQAVVRAYEAIVGLGATAELEGHAARMRAAFQKRTGSFLSEDPWFEPRTRAFWDDALTAQGFASLAAPHLTDAEPLAAKLAPRLARAHRGFFKVDDRDGAHATLVDLWSGAELLVTYLDEAQALAFEHAEGAMDARVVAPFDDGVLYVLPGAYHHPTEALGSATDVLAAAREQGLGTEAALDALMRMELVFRSSSRVKVAFAYKRSSLPRA